MVMVKLKHLRFLNDSRRSELGEYDNRRGFSSRLVLLYEFLSFYIRFSC
jgi:hypothetical protein